MRKNKRERGGWRTDNAVAQQKKRGWQTKKRAGNRNTQGEALRPLARSSFAPTARRTCASSIYNRPRTSTFPDRRRIFPLLPTPFASMAQLIARTPLTAARAFAHSPPQLLLLAHHLPSRYTAFLLLLRTAAARSPTTRALLVYKGSKRVNERSTRSNHLTHLLVYASTCLQGT